MYLASIPTKKKKKKKEERDRERKNVPFLELVHIKFKFVNISLLRNRSSWKTQSYSAFRR